MAETGNRISGVALAAIGAGWLLAYAGMRNVTPLQALRDLLSMHPPGVSTSGTSLATSTSGGVATATTEGSVSSGIGAKIVASAQHYIGVPYRFGGADPSGFDCSGLVTYVLHHDCGVNLPDNSHTNTTQFLSWNGLITVPAIQRLPGDLVCTGGHIQIYVGSDSVIEAPHTGAVVRQVRGWQPAGVFRRIAVNIGTTPKEGH